MKANETRVCCARCKCSWVVVGERKPFSHKIIVDRKLLVCLECGWDNSKAAKRERERSAV